MPMDVWSDPPPPAVAGSRLRPSLRSGSSPGCAGCSTSTRSSSRSVGGTLLVLLAATTRASVAAAIYAASVSALFGVSALYHRVTWTPRPGAACAGSTTR